MPFGVYIHFPWCAVHCPYCDFAVSTARPIPQARYAEAVLAELSLRAPGFEGGGLVSVYLGGGTPSLWEPDEVGRVLSAVAARFAARPREVTLEANPESAGDPGRLRAYRDAGVNRLSIGVQSFDPDVLRKLGRRHGPEQAERALRAAGEVFEDVAADLIYGARRSTVESAARDAARLAALPVTHVSAYALTLDPEVMAEEVPFARMRREGRLPLPDEEEVLAQARAIRAGLRRGGLRRYEISNFARPGREAVHNRLYWEGESYLGLGAGAVGARLREGEGGRRWSNHRAPADYLAAVEAGRAPSAEEEALDPPALARERLMLGLRLREGVPLSLIPPARRGELGALRARRLALAGGGRLRLTSRGMDLHSAIAERLLP
ncbi:MAG TPA: coproporphyrinogen-III oxidase family protein [Anaeromyxobacteraceae bacterium]|nr:coproporphyrinogen-III oxidase family protein [Anaeromyxobacteraceae bacterium]